MKQLEKNDNRQYDYSNSFVESRPEYELIVDLIENGQKVLDLGCGEGSLMQKIVQHRGSEVKGIELSPSGVVVCKKKGLDVEEGSIDNKLNIPDGSFDVVVCNVTIQMLMFPELLFSEMKRITRKSIIISFPNFAYWLNRLELLFFGRMPRKLLFGYTWFNTGHIHQLSLRDFQELVNVDTDVRMTKLSIAPTGHFIIDKLASWMPNIFGKVIIIKLEL